jgi:multidrug resistance efflux pump
LRTTTIEDQLSEARREIDRLQAEVAARSAAWSLDGGWASFAAAVESELRGWDTYLERLQTGVAASAWKTREQAETAIAEVRSRRIAVEERLAQACDGAGDGGQEQRERVTAARDELAQKAHQLPTKFN